MPAIVKIISLITLLVISKPVSSQRGINDNSPNSSHDSLKNIYAVIAGVSKYKKLHPLNYADRDAIRFRNFLISPAGGNVKASNIKIYLNEEVTEGSIVSDCFVWLNEKKIEKGDRIYFYLAGHGDGYNNKYFYFTSDADTASGPKNYHIQGNLNIADLIENLSYYVENKGAEVLLVVDACRTNENSNQGDKERSNNFSKISIDKYHYISNFYTFYSTKDGYPAYESPHIGGGHGIFTYFLIDAMLGIADDEVSGNKDSVVTLFELASWLKTRIPQKSKEIFKTEQMPDYCCEQDDRHIITRVNNQFKKQYVDNTKNLASILSDDSYPQKGLVAKRGLAENGNDTAQILLYNNFMNTIKLHRLVGTNSAEYFYDKMVARAPNNNLTEDARHHLIIELIDFAQSKINLYLSGEDVGFIREKLRDLNDLNSDDYIKVNKIFLINFNDAADYLDKAIRLIGNDRRTIAKLQSKLLFLRARSYFDKNTDNKISLKEAIKLTEKALKAEPGAVHLYHLLAMLEMENNNKKKAQDYFTKAMEEETRWSKANLELGFYYYQLKRYDLADKYYRTAISTNKNFAYAYNNLAILMQQQKKYGEAEKFYKLSIEKRPGDTVLNYNLANFYNERGLAYKASNDIINAEKYLIMALEVDSNFFHSYINLGNICVMKGNHKKAEEYYAKAISKAGTNITTYYNLGILFYNNKNLSQADAYFKKVVLLSTTEDELYKNSKKYINEISQKSQQDIGKRMTIDDTTRSLYDRANQYYVDSNFEEAEKLFLEALDKEPGSCKIIAGIGKVYLKKKEFQEAERYLITCANTDKFDQPSYLLLGTCYELQRKIQQAEKTYIDYYTHNPKDKGILNRLIEFYGKQSEPRKVKKYKKELTKL